MRGGGIGWAICLAGLPFSHFVIRLLVPFQGLDLWHTNAWWMQAWILILAGVHSTTRKSFGIVPSAIWWMVLWATFSILWVFNSQLKTEAAYPAFLLLGVSNLWIILLALLTMTAWTPGALRTVVTAIFWSGVVLICYGWLQVANLDQFFSYVDGSKPDDQLVGTIGNTTHFAGQLALWLPLALIQPRWQKLWVLPALGLLLLAQSSTALLVAGGILIAYAWRQSWNVGLSVGIAECVGGVWWVGAHPNWLNPYGRWVTWTAWWNDMLLQRPITGWIVGFVKHTSQQLPPDHLLANWKHLHNEYLQWWVETGVIGIVLLGWAIWMLWMRRRNSPPSPLRWACGSLLCACAAMGLLNFPAHLWQLGGWGLVGLAGWIVLTEELDGRFSHR